MAPIPRAELRGGRRNSREKRMRTREGSGQDTLPSLKGGRHFSEERRGERVGSAVFSVRGGGCGVAVCGGGGCGQREAESVVGSVVGVDG